MIKGSKHGPETLAKMSAAQSGHPVSAETRAKLGARARETMIGNKNACGPDRVPVSDETRRRLSEGQSRRWADLGYAHPSYEEVAPLYDAGLGAKAIAVQLGASGARYIVGVLRRGGHPIHDRGSARQAETRARNKIVREHYREQEASQGGLCAICRRTKVAVSRWGTPLRLARDHNHRTERLRGLLCYACNTMLGAAKDDPAILEAGVAYLRRWS